jgi:DNA-binding GntR family transcriptional regulator
MAEEQDFNIFLKLDEKFHYSILETTGNSTLISIINQMRGHLNRIRYLELQETKHMRQLVNEHEAIFQAIISNDVKKTEELLSHHIRWLEASTHELIEKFPHFFNE